MTYASSSRMFSAVSADVTAATVNNDTFYPGFGPGGGDVQIKPGAIAIFAGFIDRLNLDCGKLGHSAFPGFPTLGSGFYGTTRELKGPIGTAFTNNYGVFLGFTGRPWMLLWRREWDSNPRYSHPYSGFQDRRLRPLGHPSGTGSRYEFMEERLNCSSICHSFAIPVFHDAPRISKTVGGLFLHRRLNVRV